MKYQIKAYFHKFGITEMLNKFLDDGIEANIEVRRFNGLVIHRPELCFEADVETDSFEFFTSVRYIYCTMEESTMKLCRQLI